MPRPDPVSAREFALEVVRQLRAAGYEALWAGGCVRDQLMGREPKDYDVATSALPEQIRHVFGRRRTMAIGAAFGVITVVGGPEAGQIDVATFRQDVSYSDGRHPDSITFCSAAEDAQRRDFTINGLFYDPLAEQVIDFVGGQEDLNKGLIRAIGAAGDRFAEDKLRMLRAVRFATTLSFDIEPETCQAINAAAHEITQVSAERIAEELRRMLVHPARHRALELLRSTHLLAAVFPRLASLWPTAEPTDPARALAWDQTIRILERLSEPTVAVAFAAVVREAFLSEGGKESWLHELAADLRLSNEEREGMLFLLSHEGMIRRASATFWPMLQRVLIKPRSPELLDFAEAVADVLDGNIDEIRYCREKLALPSAELNPRPLIFGGDLAALGIPAGPVYKQLLEDARDAQLIGLLHSRDQALEWVRTRWLKSESSP